MSECCIGVDFQGMRERWATYHNRHAGAGNIIRHRAFQGLREGHGVPVEPLLRSVGLDRSPLHEVVVSMAKQGLITLSPSGDTITGSAGLSIIPSRHKLLLNGTQLYAWCALDAVGIPAALEANASVQSQCAASGESIWLEFQAGRITRASHPETHLWIVTPDSEPSMCGGTCGQIHFFASPQRFDGWRAQRPEGHGILLTLDQAADWGREVWRDFQ